MPFVEENKFTIKFAEYVGGRDDIWYATNGEIFDYVTAYDNLQWAAHCSYVYNPSALDICVNYYGNKHIVPTGKTIKL